MPVTNPPASDRKRTPTSIGLLSPDAVVVGVVVALQIVHGHARAAPDSRLPLSSTARVCRFAGPVVVGVKVYVQLWVPEASCQVGPPSVETSTPATTPPPVSAAVPVTVTGVPAVSVVPA